MTHRKPRTTSQVHHGDAQMSTTNGNYYRLRKTVGGNWMIEKYDMNGCELFCFGPYWFRWTAVHRLLWALVCDGIVKVDR